MELITQYLKIINRYPFKILTDDEFKIINSKNKLENETQSFFSQNFNDVQIGSIQIANSPRTLIYDSGNNSYFHLAPTQTMTFQVPSVSIQNPEIHFHESDSNILYSMNYSDVLVNLNQRTIIINTNTISFILGEYKIFEDGEEYSGSKLFYSYVIPILISWLDSCYQINESQVISDTDIRNLAHFTRQYAEERYERKF